MNTSDPFSNTPQSPVAISSEPVVTLDKSETILEVWQLNQAVAKALERQFPLVWVRGEVSNLTRAASGHVYFTLKDAQASVRCVMFKNKVLASPVQLREGLKVQARALVSLYQARGDFQLNIESLRPAGAGSLHEQFLQIKERLLAQGLLDVERKRALPAMPRAIGVVSSLQAAALQDVLTALARRAPHIRVIVYPSAVQGEQAAGQLKAALQTAAQRHEVEVLLLVRGGGSIEDLWSFNDEALAHQIAAMPMPVISGVGHETDFTIADFVADLRAPTPTAAAELAATSQREWIQQVQALYDACKDAMDMCWQAAAQRLDRAQQALLSPSQKVQRQGLNLMRLLDRLRHAHTLERTQQQHQLTQLAQALHAHRPRVQTQTQRVHHLQQRFALSLRTPSNQLLNRLQLLQARLAACDPQTPLSKGYALVFNEHGQLMSQAAQAEQATRLMLQFADGSVQTKVEPSKPQTDLPLF